jgi:N6-L-threonylcarbamoyladenine synthase
MLVLGIETSCDETGAALIEGDSRKKNVKLISNKLASSLLLHSKTGGIIPEIAAREQVKYMIPVLDSALKKLEGSTSGVAAQKKSSIINRQSSIVNKIDAIAVTVGPGLIGSLLVGVETARTLSFAWKKPLISVNHLIGHIYANFIDQPSKIEFPALALIVSGGHTDLLLIKNHGNIKWLGGTRDDAAGEAFDKIGRLLGLPYPGGPSIEKAAEKGNPKKFNFPRPLIDSDDFDFSFSGLKTAVYREVQRIKSLTDQTICDISREVEQAVVDVLVKKTIDAAKKYKVKSILLGGGVASNTKLTESIKREMKNGKMEIPLFVPQKRLCTDNAAMIATAAFYNYKTVDWRKISANPELYFY